MDKTLWYMGGIVRLDSMLSHYRKQAWRFPKQAAFWRSLARTMIAEYRKQQAEASERLAA